MYFNAHRAEDAPALGPDDFLVFKPRPDLALESDLDREIACWFKDR